MLFILPIIPIVLSCIIGTITTSLASRFKFKNLAQIVTTTIVLLCVFYISMNLDGFFNYLTKHATSLNDLIIKIYYPAGMYAKLATDFNLLDLLIFIGINILIFVVAILVLSKFYFKINSRLKKVTSTKKTSINKLTIKRNSQTSSLIKKELNTFFKTPVFIVNAGFGLVLFIGAAILVSIKYDSVILILSDPLKFNLSKDLINNNISLIVMMLIAMAGFMTSITNSVISLEGKNINILKSLPIKTKTILMSKVYSSLIITTPPILVGDLILFIRFRLSIIQMILLLLISILIPLISHLVGIIVNLRYPKLDWENQAEVVKQSTSSFVAVMIGLVSLVLLVGIVFKLVGVVSQTIILLVSVGLFTIINMILYLYLIKKGTKEFNKLSI
jgi:ABC-2 type transport system permease protein